MSAYGTYSKARRRLGDADHPAYAFTPDAMELIKRASAFLFEIKSINAELRPDAVMPEFAAGPEGARLDGSGRRDQSVARLGLHRQMIALLAAPCPP